MSVLSEQLGFGSDARVLIVHEDDVGMCHGANVAFRELRADGFLTCGAVMVPCPWFPEIAEAAAADPSLDVGVHLTLTSEWPHYRWRPLTTTSSTSGLIDDDGYFWRNCLQLRAHIVPEAAEIELRAQIDQALKRGIDVTHLDAHMGAALVPELGELYLRLGRDYRLPVLLPRAMQEYRAVLKMGEIDPAWHDALVAQGEALGFPMIDHFIMTPGVPSADSEATYQRMIAEAPDGVTYFALHCNAPGDIEAIVPPRAHWRTDEYRLLKGRSFADRAATEGVQSVGMQALRALMRGAGAG